MAVRPDMDDTARRGACSLCSPSLGAARHSASRRREDGARPRRHPTWWDCAEKAFPEAELLGGRTRERQRPGGHQRPNGVPRVLTPSCSTAVGRALFFLDKRPRPNFELTKPEGITSYYIAAAYSFAKEMQHAAAYSFAKGKIT